MWHVKDRAVDYGIRRKVVGVTIIFGKPHPYARWPKDLRPAIWWFDRMARGSCRWSAQRRRSFAIKWQRFVMSHSAELK